MKYIILILMFTAQLFGATWYVSTAGAGAKDGTTAATAWDTFANVTWGVGGVVAGDTLYVIDSMDEKLTVGAAGTSGSPITIRGDASGSVAGTINGRGTPAGWETGGTWTQVGVTDVWTIAAVRKRMWLDGIEYPTAADAVSVDITSRLFASGTNTYIYATEDPATFYSSIEASFIDSGVTTLLNIDTKDYITVKDITVTGGADAVLVTDSANCIIEGCTIGASAEGSGVTIGKSASGITANGIIRNCTLDSGMIVGTTYSTGIPYEAVEARAGTQGWQMYGNTTTNWKHGGITFTGSAALPTINNIVRDNEVTAPDINYGRAFYTISDSALGSCSNNKFYNNNVHDTTVRSQFGGDNNEIFNNLFYTMPDVSWHTAEQALSLEPVTAGISKFNKVYNNTIYDCFMNAIIVNDSSRGGGTVLVEGNEITNNIMFGAFDDYAMDIAEGDPATSIGGNTYKNNLIYDSGQSDVVNYREVARTIAEFNGENGNNSDVIMNNISSDPQFINPPTDFHLGSNSPCLGIGRYNEEYPLGRNRYNRFGTRR